MTYLIMLILDVISNFFQVIDDILRSDDKNNDGFLNFIEFSEAEKHFF